MLAKFWSIGLVLCGVGLFGVAAWQYLDVEDGPGMTVDEPEREISGCSAGQTKVITFAFQNHARHPVQIVGLATC